MEEGRIPDRSWLERVLAGGPTISQELIAEIPPELLKIEQDEKPRFSTPWFAKAAKSDWERRRRAVRGRLPKL
jgi:hypothetical protein